MVKDAAVFEATYGAGLPIAGQFAGSLDNAGETIELRDAAGRIIHRFTFDDDWYAETDGDGFSLTIIDATEADPQAWGEPGAWRPSTEIGGSPGLADSDIVP